MVIQVEDWTDLAWRHVNLSNKRNIYGVEDDDLFQCAMIGILLASKEYKEEHGKFETYAYWFIQGEINNMIYKKTKTGRIQRNREVLLPDLDRAIDERSSYDDPADDATWIAEFMTTIPLDQDDKAYLMDIIHFGEPDAAKMYQKQHNVTRQSASLRKQKIRKIAKKHLGDR